MTHSIKVVLASLLFAALLGLGAFGLAVWGPDGAVTGPLVDAGTIAQKIATAHAASPSIATVQQRSNGPTSAGEIPTPYLGLEYLTITPEVAAYYGLAQQNGVYVESVVPNSPAAKAGIQTGSIIIKFDGVSLDATKDLLQLLLNCKPGDTVAMSVIAPNSTIIKQTSVVLGTRATNP